MDTRLLDEDAVMQICFITDNLEKSIEWFANLTGKTASHIGKSATPNIDVEFLEPGPEPSTWRDQLNEKGPGFHHFAFRTRNMSKRRQFFESNGHPMLQHGEFEHSNGRYEYFDTSDAMGAIFELLGWDNNKEAQA
ncbi:MAG: VOC family protein, partial [Candidatus Devosia euplotis]|nr:VOC family protein [Candidatus Devosia euplotis]